MVVKKQSHETERKTPTLVRDRQRPTDPLWLTVRQLALQEQKDRPQPFLSLRDAARQFKVPLSSMAAVYRRLKAEGILSSVRASGTMLQGRETGRTLQVRAVIGMPLSIPLLHSFQAYRHCYLCLRKELHARGFVVSPFHFEELNIQPEFIAQRARQEKVDAVIWLRPIGIRHDTHLRLRDLGIRFTEINLGGLVVGFCRYEVRRGRAVELILHEWRNALKFTGVTFLRAGKEMVGEAERIARLRRCASHQEMEFAVVTVPEGRIIRCLQSLCLKKKHGALLAASAAAILGSRANDRISQALKRCRIALIDGPMDFPFSAKVPEGLADLIMVNWEGVARRVAQDILTGEAFRPSEAIVFEAEAHLRAPLQRYPEKRVQTARHAA